MPFDTSLMPGAEPVFLRGGPSGCLCLHGFAASPAEVGWLAQSLAERNFTVYVPRLPGHGSDYRDMARMRWRDWYLAALDGYHVLRGQCERVFVAGHSMGGTLALLLASEVQVAALAVLAAPLYFESRLLPYSRWLKWVMRYSDRRDRTRLPEVARQEQTRRGEPLLGRVRYDFWSLAALGELYALAGVTRERLPSVTAPLLLVYSQADPTVPPEHGALVASRVSSRVVEQYTLQDSFHILPQDIERETVFRLVGEFFEGQLGGA